VKVLRPVWLIACGVLVEAIRRREIYVIVLLSTMIIGAVMTVDFFEIEGLAKFYREVALKIMGAAAALAVIALAARQLPREFSTRTIYPLMARPISRGAFLAGKLLGVMLAAGFCFALFMAVYVAGALYLGGGIGTIPWALFAQYVYLQMLMLLILATLSFWLSLMLNLDAAVTIGVLFYVFASTFSSVTTTIYEFASGFGQMVLRVMTYAIPQLILFDLSGKAVHVTGVGVPGTMWEPLSLKTMAELTAYGGFFALLYFGLALLWFRRKPL